jgi:hypothetical protein
MPALNLLNFLNLERLYLLGGTESKKIRKGEGSSSHTYWFLDRHLRRWQIQKKKSFFKRVSSAEKQHETVKPH